MSGLFSFNVAAFKLKTSSIGGVRYDLPECCQSFYAIVIAGVPKTNWFSTFVNNSGREEATEKVIFESSSTHPLKIKVCYCTFFKTWRVHPSLLPQLH